MSISFAITVCNELVEIQKLLSLLESSIRQEDEIVVLLDNKNGTREVKQCLQLIEGVKLHEGSFEGNFADWKNLLNSYCTGDYILQLDADELLPDIIIPYLSEIVRINLNTDLFFFPRINTVQGLTEEHINRWGWNVNEKGWVNWPDFQGRLYRNSPEIKWEGKVHEKIVGAKKYSFFPKDSFYAIIHEKNIERQEQQNNYYASL